MPSIVPITEEVVEIPEPSGLPFLGHITAINKDFPLGSMTSLADQYGEIYRLRFPGRTVVLVSTQALVNETCNEKRFKKAVKGALEIVRAGVHDGLFTAKGEEEENWGIAHRILMPAFGPLSIQGMFDDMHDVAGQLALKWARQGSQAPIMVTDDFTRLALDTLALCSMGYRFNSYYSPTLHPFIEAMGDFLTEAGTIGRRLPLPSIFYRAEDQKFDADINVLRSTAREVLEARKAGGENDRHDLLAAMLKGVDSKTGKKMTDESIMDNLITFLIAGHETTSGLLSFAFYQLMKHPEAYRKAQNEVDSVVGTGTIKVEHLAKLPYISAILRETLRINATIPLFIVEAYEDTLLAGKYPVKGGETIVNLLAKSQIDPLVFGEDANEFKPERMLDEPFEKMNKEFPNAWKPFGNGMRGCIGRPFAWQESLLVMTMLLQNFNFVLQPDYKFGYKQTLTIKPKDMYMRAILRDGLTPTILQQRLSGQPISKTKAKEVKKAASAESNDVAGVPLVVVYGSNSGTCESLAQRVATDATSHGFRVTKIDCLDSVNGALPTDQPVVIITASYEGQPPDNAGHFVSWVEGFDNSKQSLRDVSYAVFGCGHKDWTSTFHRIPKLLDSSLSEAGATRVADIGLADVSTGRVFSDFEDWEDNILWPALASRYNVPQNLKVGPALGVNVSITTPRATTLRQDVKEAIVVCTKTLTSPGYNKPPKKHVEIRLPETTTYKSGDYLVILPINPIENVARAMRRFHLPADAHLEISTDGPTTLPTNIELAANDILSSYVELSQPATKRDILLLAQAVDDEGTKGSLQELAGDAFENEISAKRVSVLDLLERFSSVKLPIGTFLAMVPPMRVRQYSISSSPLYNPTNVSVTFSVLSSPSLSGRGSYLGVATSYLNSLAEGDTVHVSIRPSHAGFSLPSNPETIPLLCIAAGTGIAPFRSFFQERASMISSGRTLAPAILFFGCRAPGIDDLYREEMDAWEKAGVVKVRRSYSRKPEESNGCKYVQDKMWKDREVVAKYWEDGAKVYVCGSRAIADGAKTMFLKIKSTMEDQKQLDEAAAEKWFTSLRNIRYVTDVFD